ncbi:hypothetical protein L6452_03141 [Arctium lappa]|uniref:Uncharacterized protein n=1 Tax=Arctium lappa TaxID=4217 RepID=A0ACB9FKT8_ARCLA|nr:hypothetical protein L6452_03141 [Arctium lappa]
MSQMAMMRRWPTKGIFRINGENSEEEFVGSNLIEDLYPMELMFIAWLFSYTYSFKSLPLQFNAVVLIVDFRATNGYMNIMYPVKLYGQYGNTHRLGYDFGSNAYDMQNGGRGWDRELGVPRTKKGQNITLAVADENENGKLSYLQGPLANGEQGDLELGDAMPVFWMYLFTHHKVFDIMPK